MTRKITFFLLIIVAGIALLNISGCKKDDLDNAPSPEETPEVPLVPEVPPVEEDRKPLKTPPPDQQKKPVDVVPQQNTRVVGWIQNYEAAKKKAVSESKHIIMNFTGSDWCKWCIVLEDEVFHKEAFIKKASEKFVLLKLDFPRDKSKLTADIQSQNARLQQQYDVQGYPTIFLTDAKGRPYAKTGYREGGVDPYLIHLEEFHKIGFMIDQLMTKAQDPSLEDHQKAIVLDKAVKLLPPEFIGKYYVDEVDRIITLDSENKAGLKQVNIINKRMWLAEKDLDSGNINAALEKIDSTLKEFEVAGQTAQEIYYFKALILNSKGDREATLESLKKSLHAAPDSEFGQNVRQAIINNFPGAQID